MVILFLLILIIIILSIITINKAHKHSVRKKVIVGSIKLKSLNDINLKYHFYDIKRDYFYTHICKTKREFDRFNPDGYLKIIIEDEDFFSILKNTKSNEKIYAQYTEELKRLPDSEYQKKLWIKIEANLLEEQALHPVTGFSIALNWSYTSPKGRNQYANKKVYAYAQIPYMVNEVNVELKAKNSRQAAIKRERALMTDDLRYDVLKRDNYTCQICGSTAADGVKLEIDHIIPVSKGGKTELSNLRVLCDRCNRGKSNKI